MFAPLTNRSHLRVAQPPAGEAAVAAWRCIEADRSAVAELRQAPGPAGGPALPPRFLHHADEQTVAGLAAVLKVIADEGWSAGNFSQWGVVGATRFAGRSTSAVTLPKFLTSGPAAISPHLIPQLSLHSMSGAISVALGMHGPNFGVGGGPGAVCEALMAALTMLDESMAPGMWLVISEWSPELAVDTTGQLSGPPPVCHAAAIALTLQASGRLRLRLTSVAPRVQPAVDGASLAGAALGRSRPTLTVAGLAALFASAENAGLRRASLSSGWGLEISRTAEQVRRAA
jgi:hypothetical protein